MTADPRVHLAHILESAEKIQRYIQSGEEAFQRDTMIQDAVIRNFEVIGEGVKRIPEPYRTAHPDIPWRLMAGFRDVLSIVMKASTRSVYGSRPTMIFRPSSKFSRRSFLRLNNSNVSFRAKIRKIAQIGEWPEELASVQDETGPITPNGAVKVLDFELAKRVRTSEVALIALSAGLSRAHAETL